MADRAVVDTASQVIFFGDRATAEGATFFVVLVAHDGFVFSGVAEDVFFGVTAVLFNHLLESVDRGGVELLDLGGVEVLDFGFGADEGVKEDVLDNAVADA